MATKSFLWGYKRGLCSHNHQNDHSSSDCEHEPGNQCLHRCHIISPQSTRILYDISVWIATKSFLWGYKRGLCSHNHQNDHSSSDCEHEPGNQCLHRCHIISPQSTRILYDISVWIATKSFLWGS